LAPAYLSPPGPWGAGGVKAPLTSPDEKSSTPSNLKAKSSAFSLGSEPDHEPLHNAAGRPPAKGAKGTTSWAAQLNSLLTRATCSWNTAH